MGFRWVRCALVLVVIASGAVAAPYAAADTPATLLANDASGMVRVLTRCPGDKAFSFDGSGFLLGPRVVMTARHVLVDYETGAPCSAEVTQNGTSRTIRITHWMGLRETHSKTRTDLALAVLAAPIDGNDFSIGSAPPHHGDAVVSFGYALGEPLSLNQGTVVKTSTENGAPVLDMKLLVGAGGSGGPILNSDGLVVGINQFGNYEYATSVDLPPLVHGTPSQFCFGIVAGEDATICPPGAKPGDVLDVDGPPQSCSNFGISYTIDEPFQTCPPSLPGESPLDLGVLSLTGHCPSGRTITGSAFLIGPRLVMTSRGNLIDPITGQGCNGIVTQGFVGPPDRILRWTWIERADSAVATDVAIGLLTKPLQGHDFTISSTPVTVNEIVHPLDSLNTDPANRRGHVTGTYMSWGLRQFGYVGYEPIPGTYGGGPILDAHDDVVGIAQTYSSKEHGYSVDLARLTDGNPHEFCVGVALGQTASVCPAPPYRSGRPLGGLLGGTGLPPDCGHAASDPPFTYCLSESGKPKATPLSPVSSAPLTFPNCWISTSSSSDHTNALTALPSTTSKFYFVFSISRLLVGTYLNFTVQPPGGITNTVSNGWLKFLNPATDFVYGPLSLPNGDTGTTTYTVSTANGPGAGDECHATISPP